MLMKFNESQLSSAQITAQARNLGIERGDVLLMHTSFRRVRPVEGGPRGLIAAIQSAIGATGTLVMPSWPEHDGVFDPQTTPAAPELGIVAETFWRIPGVLRSDHVHAFAAAGPHAERILRDPLPLPPHRVESPVGRVHELEGKVLLVGVGHEADTTLHLAELIAGVPYRLKKRCMVEKEGRAVEIDYEENDHCCARFTLVDGWLRERGLQTEGPIGYGFSKLAHASDIVKVAMRALVKDPLVFLHDPHEGCVECDAARDSISGGVA